jgi:hypothetical protein
MRATEEITIAMIDLHAKQEQRLNDAVRLLRAVVDSTQETSECFGHGDYSNVLVLGDLGTYAKDGYELLARIKEFLGDTNA